MGCQISSNRGNLKVVRIINGHGGQSTFNEANPFLNGGEVVLYTCPNGNLFEGTNVITSGAYIYTCPNDLDDDITVNLNLNCVSPPITETSCQVSKQVSSNGNFIQYKFSSGDTTCSVLELAQNGRRRRRRTSDRNSIEENKAVGNSAEKENDKVTYEF
eukprot:Pgem_evm1s18467